MQIYEDLGLLPQPQLRESRSRSSQVNWTDTTATHVLYSSGTYTLDLSGSTRVQNKSITIRNTGTANIVNPWVVMNGKRNFFNTSSILQEAVGNETDPEKRAFRIWRLVRDHRYHWYPAEATLELHSPAKYLNVYGSGFCDDSAAVLECLWKAAGFSAARSWDIIGHVISEVYYNGAFHMLDADLEVFYPKTDNSTLASVLECAANTAFVSRVSVPGIAALYTGPNQPFENQFLASPTMAMTLRPNESLERCFDNWGKFHDNLYQVEPPIYGNGRQVYVPELTTDVLQNGFTSASTVECSSDDAVKVLHPAAAGTPASVTCNMSSAYVFVGGSASMNAKLNGPGDTVTISFSKNNVNWTNLGSKSGPFDGPLTFSLDSAIATTSSIACYSWYVKIDITAAAQKDNGRISALSFLGEVQCSPRALPTLEPNTQNDVSVSFTPVSGGSMEIEHCWSFNNTEPPLAPFDGVRNPADNSSTSSVAPRLSWLSDQLSNGTGYREILVSRDAEGILPVSPLLHNKDTGPASFDVPATWLDEGRTYYWRVKELDKTAPWSSPFSFNVSSTAGVADWDNY